MNVRIGLDFGTSNSSAAVLERGGVRLLPLDPSSAQPEVAGTILYLTREGSTHIAREAVELYYQHNIGRVRQFTRKWVGEIDFYGGDLHFVRDVYAMVDEDIPGRLLQFLKTALRTPGYGGTRVFDRHYSPADLAGLYLGEVRRRASQALGAEVREAVIGRPVHLASSPQADAAAQAALRQAAAQAGFERVDFFPEPAAAALEYAQRLSAADRAGFRFWRRHAGYHHRPPGP